MNFVAKISVLITFLALAFVVVGYVSQTDVVHADFGSTCGSCDDGGGSTPNDDGDGGDDNPPSNPPKCDISASITAVEQGEQYTIYWKGTPANATFEVNDYPVQAEGQKTYTFTAENQSRFVFTGENGDGNCVDEVIVKRKTIPAPSCDFFTASPNSLPYGGGTVTLAWGTTNAQEVRLDGVVVADDDTTTRTVTSDKTFNLTVKNDTATVSCQAPVTVDEPEVGISCQDLVFTANKTTVTPGSNVTLSWVWTGNVSSGTVNQGIGSVNSGDTRSVTINNTTTFVTTISNGSTSKNCALTINTETVNTPICQGVNISASDTTVEEGDTTTLNWSWTQSYDSVSISNGIGIVSNNGSRTVTINDDETYSIAVTKNGNTQTCDSVSIDAYEDTPTGGGGGGTPNPRCEEFEASDTRISAGDRVTLSWETRFARELTLFEGDEDDGDEIYSTDDRDEVEEGEFVVRPTEDTTYTLLLERGSRDRTCDVEIEVDDNVVVLTDRGQDPRVAGISLTQVPYTGFEAGPVLTILFYLLLALWGLFVAYTFTVKRDSVLGFSLNGAFPRKQSVVDVSTDTIEAEEEVSEAAAYVATATATAPANLPTGNAPIIGYGAVANTPLTVSDDETEVVEEETEVDTLLGDIENRAHAQHALLSSDALRYFAGSYSTEEQFEALDDIIKNAKKRYPSEDGWVVINLERMQELMDVTDVVSELPSTPIKTGSLAEAIVSANAAAALAMIGQRPMVSLADATTDLDALYRMRNGGDETVSDLLASASSHVTDNQITEMLHALNSAMDGTYTTEVDAVKTAILKAIKVVS